MAADFALECCISETALMPESGIFPLNFGSAWRRFRC
jgi:hypothetical protein